MNDRDSKGLNLPPEKRRIGYVFQDARLFPHYRVRGNLQYGMAPKHARGSSTRWSTLLGIGPLLDRAAGLRSPAVKNSGWPSAARC